MATGPTPSLRREPPTLAQLWCRLGGLALLVMGLAGFFVDGSFDTGHDVQGERLIVFEVNGWHNLVHIASGLLLLAGAGHRRRAKLIALLFGMTYGLVAVYGLVDGDEVFGLFPVNPADNLLHIALTLVSLVAGIASRGQYDAERALATRLRARANLKAS